MAKKFILRELEVSPEDIAELRTNAEADELIAYLNPEKKEEAPPKEKKKVNKKLIGTGKGDFELPDPEILTDKINHTLMDRLKPLRVNNWLNQRWGSDARLMRVYTDEYPEGRIL